MRLRDKNLSTVKGRDLSEGRYSEIWVGKDIKEDLLFVHTST